MFLSLRCVRASARLYSWNCNLLSLQHDVQLDYYGKQLASAGSDRRIKIFDVVEGGQRQQTAELTGHEGPVWQVAWAHPEFGKILASCSYDRQVFVWKEHAPQHWGLVHKFLGHGENMCFSASTQAVSSSSVLLCITQCRACLPACLERVPI